MSDSRLGVAVVGCGGISHCHTYALTQVPEVRLVATIDIDDARPRLPGALWSGARLD